MTAIISCRGVSRTYGSGLDAVVALHGVTCAVGEGDKIAVTGSSGSGKTTLLHLLAGLDEPTAGEIHRHDGPTREDLPRHDGPTGGGVARRDRSTGKDAHRHDLPVGIVFQGPSLLSPLDVTENVALPLLIAGFDEGSARKRAHEALRQVGLADLGQRLPEELSGGQAQRVAVARVLAAAPRLIIADEPTGQLDSAHADDVISLLIGVADELGAGLVIATHDPAIAKRFPLRWEMSDGALGRRTC
ncbi:ABC transporter ATP-binding protein [Streptosporangium subroseum]|uniref:ABC transporter ATP-binding protein n=1 Tax=Streptosporangium subroseum TaxID=106412 RepID=UPI0030847330|nr:ATP-binding cassette domain-containing protein [Streptosporangium subroseum]